MMLKKHLKIVTECYKIVIQSKGVTMNGFNDRLRTLRKHKNLTLESLANELGTTKTTLSRYENNKRIPDADFIIKAAQFFNVSTDYLLDLTSHPSTVSDFLIANHHQDVQYSPQEIEAIKSSVRML